MKDGRDFMDLQLKAMETGDYRELADFLMFFKEDTMERVRECSRADEKEKAWMAVRFPDAVAQAVKMAAEGKAFVGRPEQVLRSRLEAMAKRQAREAAKIRKEEWHECKYLDKSAGRTNIRGEYGGGAEGEEQEDGTGDSGEPPHGGHLLERQEKKTETDKDVAPLLRVVGDRRAEG